MDQLARAHGSRIFLLVLLIVELLSGAVGSSVKKALERFIDAPEAGDNRRSPFDVFAAAFERPVGRRIIGDVGDVADLVPELYELGFA